MEINNFRRVSKYDVTEVYPKKINQTFKDPGQSYVFLVEWGTEATFLYSTVAGNEPVGTIAGSGLEVSIKKASLPLVYRPTYSDAF